MKKIGKKTKTLVSSFVSMSVAASLIVGSTFALFTSESKTNIAITSGKVKVTADAAITEAYSADWSTEENNYTNKDIPDEDGTYTFTNGGTAKYEDTKLTLSNFTPGDGVKFEISAENESTIAIKYQTVVTVTAANALYKNLEIKVNDVTIDKNLSTAVSDWTTVEKGGDIEKISVEITLPITAGNDAMLDEDGDPLSCDLVIGVYAVQSNGHDETNRNVYLISGDTNLGDVVSSMGEEGGTLALAEDIELGEGNTFEVPEGSDVVVDTQDSTLNVVSGTASAISVPANSSLTLKGNKTEGDASNVVLNSKTTTNAAVDVSGKGAELNLEDVAIECANESEGSNNKPSITAQEGAQVYIGEGAKISASEMRNAETHATTSNYKTHPANANILEASGSGTVVTIDGAEISTEGSGCGILSTDGAEVDFESGKITISAGGGASALAVGNSATVRMSGGEIEVTGDLASKGGVGFYDSLKNTAAAIGDTATYSNESDIFITGGVIRLTPTSGIAIAVAMEGWQCLSAARLGGDVEIYVNAQGTAKAYAFASAMGDPIGICEDVYVHGAKKNGVLGFGDEEFILYDSNVFNNSAFIDPDFTDYRNGFVDDNRGKTWEEAFKNVPKY